MNERHIKGGAEIQRFMDQLSAKFEQNVARGSMRSAAAVVRKEARVQLAAHDSVKTAELSKGLKIGTGAKGGVVKATIRQAGKHAFIAHWLEFTGAVAHRIVAHRIVAKAGGMLFFGGLFAKSLQHPGFKPKPYLRPALDGKAGDAFVAAAEYAKTKLATKHGFNTADIEVQEK